MTNFSLIKVIIASLEVVVVVVVEIRYRKKKTSIGGFWNLISKGGQRLNVPELL